MDTHLKYGESRVARGIDHRCSGRVPAATIDPGTVAGQVGIGCTADAPDDRHVLGRDAVINGAEQRLDLQCALRRIEQR